MGLDMYLEGRYWAGKKEENRIRDALRGIVPDIDVKSGDGAEYIYIITKIGYWRKANAIHRWFVENVQDGKDDCREYYVSRDNLKKLKKLCQRVLDNPELAPELLPTQKGFFFGNTAYNEWYFEDLKRTIEIIDRALNMDEKWEFTYYSSW